jgi:hypothetical protein
MKSDKITIHIHVILTEMRNIILKGGEKMISNQILQSTIDGLKGITRIDICVMDTEGKVLASTIENADHYESSVLRLWIRLQTAKAFRDTNFLRCLTSIN